MTMAPIRKSAGLAGLAFAAAIVVASPGALAGGPGHCPPGLAKKGACGGHYVERHHHDHRYRRGERIVEYRVIEYDHYDLHPPRHGHVYVESGGRIYLMAEATQRVIEAINLVDAASR